MIDFKQKIAEQISKTTNIPEHTDCLGIVSIRSVSRELYAGRLRVVDVKGLEMKREFNFAQLQGQESGLSQVFMQFTQR